MGPRGCARARPSVDARGDGVASVRSIDDARVGLRARSTAARRTRGRTFEERLTYSTNHDSSEVPLIGKNFRVRRVNPRRVDPRRVSASMPSQCAATTLIGAAFCAKRCSSERLARELAFFPPEPSSYALVERDANAPITDAPDARTASTNARDDFGASSGRFRAVANAAHVPETHAKAFQRVLDEFRVDAATTARGNEVVYMACEPPATRISGADADDARCGADITVVYSHGNAVDAGEIAPFARKLSQHLQCRVVTYDYSGYGESRGEPSVADTYADVEAVVEAVMRTYALRRREIILLGQSIGSGPTCHLASKSEQQFGESFGAVVLVSPLLSALSVVSAENAWCTPAKVFKRMDVYKNYQIVKNIKCPILLIHGDRDDVVPASHGAALWELVRKNAKRDDAVLEPYWIHGAGHDDTYERNPAEFVRRLRDVVALVRERFTFGP